MKKNSIIFFFVVCLSPFLGLSQSPVGFWEVTEVSAGERNMTPVAKWFKISEDSSWTSGNGWLQNASGTWSYDEEKQLYHVINDMGPLDPFGAFQVSYTDAGMQWQRQEEDMLVKVKLQSITELPMAPADQLTGLWEQESDSTSNADSSLPQTFFFRWDRIYNAFDEEGNRTAGYWHMHGHRPQLTLVPYDEEKKRERFNVSFRNEKLVLENESLKVIYKSSRQLP